MSGARSSEEVWGHLGLGVTKEAPTPQKEARLGPENVWEQQTCLWGRLWWWGGRVWQLRASQKTGSQGGVGCLSCLVPPTLATAGRSWVVPTGSWHTMLLAEIGGHREDYREGGEVPWGLGLGWPCTRDKNRESPQERRPAPNPSLQLPVNFRA